MNDDIEKLAERYGVKLPTPPTPPMSPKGEPLRRAARKLGVDPADLGAIISFETGGTFDPHKVGGEGNKYKGLIQFGPEEQKTYYNPKDTFDTQVEDGVVRYFQDRFKKAGRSTQGASLEDLYTTVIAGNPKANRNAKDSFGTSALSGTERILKEHRPKVVKEILGGQSSTPQIDFDKLSSRYLQGNEFSTLAERYGVAPTQVEGQKPLLRPGQPLGTDLPPTNPTGVALKTGVTDVPPVQQPVQPPVPPSVQPPIQQQPSVQRPIEPRKVARPTYATGEPVISDESYDEQGNVIPPTTNLSTGAFTRDTSGGAVADLIEIPKSVKTANEANEYVKGQLRAKYKDIKIPDNFTFSKTWTPGTGAAVDYATLKQMGVDTDALVSEQIAQQRVGREQAPNLKMPVTPEAEAEKALDERIRSTDYAGQQRMTEFISNPANLILPVALWNSYNQQGDVLTDDWVASQKKRMLDQYGSYGKALQAEEYYKNSDWAETISRMARQTAGSFAKNLFSGTAKSIATLGQEFEDANPLNLVLPDKAKIGVRNLVNGADFLTRLMTAPSAQDAVNEMEWASGNDISKQQLYKAAQEFDKAIGDDPVLKGRFLGSLADAGGSALAFVALGAVMPAMRTTSFWGKTRDWSTAIAGAVQSAGSGYEEGKSQGLSEADARKFGVIQGLLGTSEMVGAGSELTSFLKDPTLRRQIASALLEVGKGVKREAKQEFAQEVFQTTSGRAVLEYLKDNDPSTLQKLTNALNKLPIQIAEAVTNEGITAAITGGLMGGAGAAAQVQSAETAEPIVQPTMDVPTEAPKVKPVLSTPEQDVSKKTENIGTSEPRAVSTKPLTVIPEKKGNRQDKVEFKAVVPEEQASQAPSEPKPLTTIPEKRGKAKVESKSPKQESGAELMKTPEGIEKVYKTDIAVDSTDYSYTTNQIGKIRALIDITPEGKKLTALKKREREIEANHKIATKQYSQSLKEQSDTEKKSKQKWQKEAESTSDDDLIASYNKLFYSAMGNVGNRDEIARKEIERRGLTDRIGEGVNPFKNLDREGEKVLTESSDVRRVLDRMVSPSQVRQALDYAKSLKYEGERFLPSHLLYDISQHKHADAATKKEAKALYDEFFRPKGQPEAKPKVEFKPSEVTVQEDDDVAWTQDGEIQRGIVQKVSGLSAVIEDAAGNTHRVLLTSLKPRQDTIQFKPVEQPRVERSSEAQDVKPAKSVAKKPKKASIEMPKPDDVIRDGDVINNGVKTGVLKIIDGKKRVWEGYGKTPTISNTIEYKEGNWKKGANDLMESARSGQEFYSQLERTIEQKMPAKASAEQVRGIIKDTKQEERDWSGIDQWLDEHPTATKDEVLDFVRANNVKVEVVEKGARYSSDITVDEVQKDIDAKGRYIVSNGTQIYTEDGKIWVGWSWTDDATQFDSVADALDYVRDTEHKGDTAKFSQYVLPGGENYREMLLTLPTDQTTEADFQNARKALSDYREGYLRPKYGDDWQDKATPDEIAKFKALSSTEKKLGVKDAPFKSSHFDEPNILVHIRFDDRTVDGKKILHIAEIQSDWHQAGRRKGYKQVFDPKLVTTENVIADENVLEDFEFFRSPSERTEFKVGDKVVRGKYGNQTAWIYGKTEEDVNNRLRKLFDTHLTGTNAVPDAPFKKSWHELALKKALRYAAENGYDAVSWDTGETQADRYDLSKQIDSINVPMVNDDGSRAVRIDPKDGESFKLMVDDKGIVTGNYSASQFSGKSLDDVIGKEMAQKVMDAPSNTKFTGIDLKVGGEGMKGFYDKILPAFANKYTKKWGGKVETSSFNNAHPGNRLSVRQNREGGWNIENDFAHTVESGYQSRDLAERRVAELRAEGRDEIPVHRLDITPAMRESVMQGQPMFAVRQKDVNAARDSFINAQHLEIEELLPMVDTKDIVARGDGIIDINDVPAYELVRRTMATALGGRPDFNGVFTSPDQVSKFVNTAEELAKQADSVGQDGKKFRDLAKITKKVAKEDGSVIFLLTNEALPHEKVHKVFYFTRDPKKRAEEITARADQIPSDQLEAMSKTPIFTHIQNAMGWRSYKKKSLAAQMEEVATHAVRGEFATMGITTREQERDVARLALAYLKAFAKHNAREGVSEDAILRTLAKEITYAEEVKEYIQLGEVQDKGTPDVQGSEDSNVEAPDRGTGRTVSEKRQKAPSLESKEPGKSGMASEAEKVAEAKEQKQKVAAISRVLGHEYYYDPQGHAETEERAQQLVGQMGVNDAVAEALAGRPSAEGMRVLQWEMERLNGLADYYLREGKDAEFSAVAQEAAELTAQIAKRQIALGQEVEINKLFSRLSPEVAILTAQKMVMYAKGPDAQLTTEQVKSVTQMAQALKDANSKLAGAEATIAQQESVIRSLEGRETPQRKVTHQETLLREYKARERKIKDELAKMFPNSPLFKGDVMESARETSLDPRAFNVLVNYTVGQILTGRPYKVVIDELGAISGASAEDVKAVHAEAVDRIRPAREPKDPIVKARINVRREHYKEADKFNGVKKVYSRPQLSPLAQMALDKYPNEPKLVLAIDRLTGKEPKSINAVIKDLRENYNLSIKEAELLGQKAQSVIKNLKIERREKLDAAKGIVADERKRLDEARVEKARATYRLSKFLSQLGDQKNWMQRFNNDMRAKFVSNWGTQLFNALQSTTVTMPVEIGLDLFETGLRTIGLNLGEATDVKAKNVLLPYAYLVGNHKQLAEQALAEFPEEYFKVHSGLLGDIEIEPHKIAPQKKGLAKVVHKWFDVNELLNEKLAHITGAKLQEMHFRNAMVAANFDQLIRAKSKGATNLVQAMKDGAFRDYVTEDDAKKVADRALRVTMAEWIDDPAGRFLKRGYDFIDRFVPLFLNPVTYARFTYTATRSMVANPILFGMLDAQKLGGKGYNTRSIAKGVMAWSAITLAYGLMSALGGDDDKWYTLYINGKDNPPIDIRRWYPASAYFYMAHLIKSTKDGDPRPAGDDLLEGFASLETDYFTYGAGKGLLDTVTDSKKDWGDVGVAGSRLFWNQVAGYSRFFKPMRDTLAQFDEEERKLRDYDDTAREQAISEMSKSVPFVARLSRSPVKEDVVRGGDVEAIAPMARMLGINFVHPTLLNPKDTVATKWANELFTDEFNGGKMTPEERKAYQVRRQIRNAVRGKEKTPQEVDAIIRKYQTNGTLSKESASRLRADIKLSELQARIKSAFSVNPKDINALRKVWKHATAEEKNDLRSVLKKKENRTREFNAEFGL